MIQQKQNKLLFRLTTKAIIREVQKSTFKATNIAMLPRNINENQLYQSQTENNSCIMNIANLKQVRIH